jgi:hypothetical protein
MGSEEQLHTLVDMTPESDELRLRLPVDKRLGGPQVCTQLGTERRRSA